MFVVLGPEVEKWLQQPHSDPSKAADYTARYRRARTKIEIAGRFASEDDRRKLAGFDDLYETRIFDRRIFSTIRGDVVLMASVVEKKKRRLSARTLQVQHEKVRAFAASWVAAHRQREQ